VFFCCWCELHAEYNSLTHAAVFPKAGYYMA